jgi:hypothetical protein
VLTGKRGQMRIRHQVPGRAALPDDPAEYLALLQSRSVRAAQGRSDQKPPYPVVHGTAGGLPGRYQVGWGEGGV